MKKLELNFDEETIVTVGAIISCIFGLSLIATNAKKYSDKLGDEGVLEITASIMVTMARIMKMLPRQTQSKVNAFLKEQTGTDFEELCKKM